MRNVLHLPENSRIMFSDLRCENSYMSDLKVNKNKTNAVDWKKQKNNILDLWRGQKNQLYEYWSGLKSHIYKKSLLIKAEVLKIYFSAKTVGDWKVHPAFFFYKGKSLFFLRSR